MKIWSLKHRCEEPFIVWHLVDLSGSFLDWLEQEDIKVQLYKVEEKASANLFCERSTCARVWYYYVYCYKYYILCVVPWEVNLCEGLLLLCVLLCVLTTLYYYEMLTCASIRYDLKSVYYTCDTVILLGSNCVWLEVVSVLHSHWMSCSGNALPHLFCEGSTTNDCCEGHTWPGSLHDMKVRTTCCRIYTKGHLCESHSLSDSPVSMKKWVGEPDDWQENLFISSPLLQVGGGSDSFSHCPAWGWVSRPHCPHSRGRVGESVKWLHIFFTDNCDSASFLVQENLPGRLDLD